MLDHSGIGSRLNKW
ncbi:hypothetical protein ECFDA504_4688, partial [Escherichia coli FDA504]